MHFHVLGYGPIGALVSYHLRKSLDPRHIVSVIHRSPLRAHNAQISPLVAEYDGVAVPVLNVFHQSSDPSEDVAWRAHALHVSEGEAAARLPPGPKPIQSLIVATKAQVAIAGIRALLPRLSPDSTLVLLHNGMGIYEDLIRNVFRNRDLRPHIVLCVNNHGALLKQLGHVVHAGLGDILLGIAPDVRGRKFEASYARDSSHHPALSLDDITPIPPLPATERYLTLRETIAAFAQAEQLNASWQPLYDVQIKMRRKLVVNAVINPLTALLNCRNGDIFRDEAGRRLAWRICREASDIFRAHWASELTARTQRGADEDDARLVHVHFPRELTATALMWEVERVVLLTRRNASSMLTDVRRRKDTEISFINGYLLNLAKKVRVLVPTIASTVDLMTLRSIIPLDQAVPLDPKL